MRKFFIVSKQREGVVPLYIRVRKKSPYVDFWINTHIEVNIEKWEKAFGDIQLYSKSGKDGKKVELLAQDIDKAIDEALTREFSRETVQDAVDAVAFKEEKERQKQIEEEARRKHEEEEAYKRMVQAKEDADVILYLTNLIEGMKNGSLLIEGKGRNRGEKYTVSTIKMWNNLLGILRRYNNEHPFTWSDIDKHFAVDFQNWLENEGYMAKSVNKYVGQFIALINRAYNDGKHTNVGASTSFIKKAVAEEKKATEIYLTADELNALYNMQLTGEDAIVRDVFIVGCCTCQRVSDYSNLKRENFTTTARGTKVVKLKQTKTRRNVVIPVLDDKLLKIAKKYNYQIPSVPDQVLNRYIKDICKRLSVNVKSLAVELPTVLTMKERAKEEREEISYKRDSHGRVVKPRYELITSHTARRTGITNLYLTGKFDVFQMMSVSGHKEAKTFKEYIKLSDEEIAEGIAEKMDNVNLF